MKPEWMLGNHALVRQRHATGVVAGCALIMIGCGSGSRVGNDPTADLPSSPVLTERSDRGQRLPPPDPAEIHFDADTNLLRLYEKKLPPSARWMVQWHNDKAAIPVGLEYKLPEDIDPEKTFIYYTLPAGRQSKLVTLAEVQQAGELLTSRVP